MHISWCIELLSSITPLLPSLDIEWLNDFESNSKSGPRYSGSLEIFSVLMSSSIRSNLLIIN